MGTVWKCSKKYGCPPGYENGKWCCSSGRQLMQKNTKIMCLLRKRWMGMKAEADAAVEAQWKLDHPEEYQ